MLLSPKFGKINTLSIDPKFSKLYYYQNEDDILKKSLINFHLQNYLVIDIVKTIETVFVLHKNIDRQSNILQDKEKSFILNKKKIVALINEIKNNLRFINPEYTVTSVKTCRNDNLIVFYTNSKDCTADIEHRHRNNHRYYLFNNTFGTLSANCHCGNGKLVIIKVTFMD